MKTLSTLASITLILFSSFTATAQVPDGINWQAVLRDAGGAVMASQPVTLRLTLHENGAGGPVEFQETHALTTSAQGLINVEIGTGTATIGTLPGVDWFNNEKWLQVEVDPGTGFADMGAQKLVSVPFALLAREVENDAVNDADSDPTNELQTMTKTGSTVTLSHGGGTYVDEVLDPDSDPTNELQTISQIGTNVTLSNGGGTISTNDADSNPSNELNTTMTLTGQTLFLTDAGGTLSVDLSSLGDDADPDPTNELNQSFNFDGVSQLDITDAGGTFSVDLSALEDDADADPTNELNTNFTFDGVSQVDITDAGGTFSIDLSALEDDADPDPTNELIQSVTYDGVSVLTITDAGGVYPIDLINLEDDADADPTNEYNQSVVLSGTTLQTTDGGGTINTDLSSLVDDADADPTNELQTISASGPTSQPSIDLSNGGGSVQLFGAGATTLSQSGNNITISSTDNVNDADANPTNELQSFVVSGTTVPVVSLSPATNSMSFSGSGGVTLSRSGNNIDIFSTDNGLLGGGTLNYVAKWTPTGITLGNSQIFDNGTNVGIGTINPANRLDVEGGAVIGALYSGTNVAPTNGLLVQGNVGIGTATPSDKLHVVGTVAQMRIEDSDDGSFLWLSAPGFGYTGGVGMGTNHDLPLFTNNIDRVVIKAGGNVGIGTASPTEILDVNGQVRIRGGGVGAGKLLMDSDGAGTAVWSTPAGAGVVSGTGTATEVAFWNSASTITSNSNLFWDNSSGRLGIGTSTPVGGVQIDRPGQGSHIHLNHPTSGSNSSDGLWFGHDATESTVFIWNYENSPIRFGTNSVARMEIEAGGNVGIGTITPAARLHVTGGDVLIQRDQAYQSENPGFADVEIELVQLNLVGADPIVVVGDNSSDLEDLWIQTPIGANKGVQIRNGANILAHFDQGGTTTLGGTFGSFTANNTATMTPSGASPNDATLGFVTSTQAGGLFFEESTGDLHVTMNSNTVSSGAKVMTFEDVSGNVGIGTSAPSATLDVVGTFQYEHGSAGLNRILIDNSGAGDAVWEEISTVGAPHFWSTIGNAGTVDGTNFIGTTDGIPFNVRVNNVPSGRIDHLLDNTFFGYRTNLSITTGERNTMIGDRAGESTSTGNSNVGVGFQALIANNAGGNTAVGAYSTQSNTTGVNNTSLGYATNWQNVAGDNNTAIGLNSLWNNLGSNNTGLGRGSLVANTTGTDNTAVGFGADVGSGALSNATAVGANATVNTSNSLVLGNNANVGIGTSAPSSTLDVVGTFQYDHGSAGAGNILLDNTGAGDAVWSTPAAAGLVSGSGTLNFVPKWTPDGTTLGNSQIFDNGSQVQIGASGNGSTLNLGNSGGGALPSLSFFDGTEGFNIHENALGQLNFEANNTGVGGGTIAMTIDDNTFNVGIGTITPTALLHVDGSVAIGSQTAATTPTSFAGGIQSTSSGIRSFAYGDNAVASGQEAIALGNQITVSGLNSVGIGLALSTSYTVSQDHTMAVMGGNVGIGTTAPSATLDVVGTFQLVDGTQANGRVLTSDAAGNASWQTPSNSGLADWGRASAAGFSPTATIGFLSPPSNAVTITAATQKVHVTASKAMGSTAAGGADGLRLWIGYNTNGAQTPVTTAGGGTYGQSAAQDTRQVYTLSYIVTGLAPGTYYFGLVGDDSNGNEADWNSNEWGYVSVLVLD